MIEIDILNGIQHMRCPFLDGFIPQFTRLGDAGILWIVLGCMLLVAPHTRKTGFAVAIAIALDVLICNVFLKNVCARPRPYTVNTEIELLIQEPSDYSFPSGHAGVAFTAVGALFFRKDKMWIPSLVLATLIAFTRMYLYVHYPTDILAGAVIGIVCGYCANVAVNYLHVYYRKFKRRIVNPHEKRLP